MDFAGWRAKMFAGDIVNTSEGRPAKHWLLRAADAPDEVKAARAKMIAFAQRMRREIDAIVHLGIGGSDLGPRLILDALHAHRIRGIDVRFAANVDGADVADAIAGLKPARTLLIVASKTFTTQETLANAAFVRAWGPKHIAAATAAPDKAVAWGVPADNVFPFWDWVGGRYSLWSSVSLACAIALAAGPYQRLLAGAAEMDAHFRDAPFARNLPALSAAVQMWNREALGHGSYALIPYSERLRLLPAYMQQLEMESNGKGVSRDGESLAALGLRGDLGRGGHQRAAFVLSIACTRAWRKFRSSSSSMPARMKARASHRAKVFANALAQARALMVGKSADAPHRAFAGNRASTMMAMDALSPEALGALLAFYEHRTFTQAVLAGHQSVRPIRRGAGQGDGERSSCPRWRAARRPPIWTPAPLPG